MRASRVVRIVGLLAVVVALVLALVPFRTGIEMRGGFVLASPSSSVACGMPIVEAMRSQPSGGWMGYVPLTSTLGTSARFACPGPARHRLLVSEAFLVLALVLGFIAMIIDRPPGLGWRRRLHYGL